MILNLGRIGTWGASRSGSFVSGAPRGRREGKIVCSIGLTRPPLWVDPLRMGNETEPWQAKARCRDLTPQDSDALFFPTVGGKSNKARSFCSLCPVQGSCLMDALETKLDGFFSGTTPQERSVMASLYGKALRTLDEVMPPEPVRKATVSKYRKVIETPDPYAWLDEADPRFVDLY